MKGDLTGSVRACARRPVWLARVRLEVFETRGAGIGDGLCGVRLRRDGAARAGVYIGNYSRRTRDVIWDEVVNAIEDGKIAWVAPNDAGFSFETCGLPPAAITHAPNVLTPVESPQAV
jgi:CRISPR-associated endoribonuclease Cas2 subtype I-E